MGIAYGSAALFDVSFALGAFFAGVLLSESDLSHQAAADSLPLQDAFAVLFFVSVGMLFDPSIVVRDPLAVLAVLAAIVVGKSIAAFVIVLVFRYPVATALTVSASLAQIGEFSFILAAMGVSLGLLPPEGRDLDSGGGADLDHAQSVRVRDDHARDAVGARAAGLYWRWWSGGPRGSSALPENPRSNALRDHAVIVGYGRVGSMIGQALADQRRRSS